MCSRKIVASPGQSTMSSRPSRRYRRQQEPLRARRCGGPARARDGDRKRHHGGPRCRALPLPRKDRRAPARGGVGRCRPDRRRRGRAHQSRLAVSPRRARPAVRVLAIACVERFRGHRLGAAALGRARDTAIGQSAPPRDGIKLVLGPGTGLGVAAILPVDGCWHVVASEGGHACFGPQAADEVEVFARLRDECGSVSAETVLSGRGLARLARALDPRAARQTSETIVAGASAGEPSALAATRLFVRLLGRFAGGLALTFKAQGGVYITGGVASGLGSLLEEPQFRCGVRGASALRGAAPGDPDSARDLPGARSHRLRRFGADIDGRAGIGALTPDRNRRTPRDDARRHPARSSRTRHARCRAVHGWRRPPLRRQQCLRHGQPENHRPRSRSRETRST